MRRESSMDKGQGIIGVDKRGGAPRVDFSNKTRRCNIAHDYEPTL